MTVTRRRTQVPPTRASKVRLRRLIFKSLRSQGYRIERERLLPPEVLDKASVRALHAQAVSHWRELARPGLERDENRLLKRIASGRDVNPAKVQPRLVEVQRGSEDELLFRYAKLHWSIPVSYGYGRRLRYLVVDEQNHALVGIFGLSDPVIGLPPRDDWIGWTPDTRNHNLRHTMDAYVMGAVPPYSSLLCGKLVAMLAASDEVRTAFRRKYGDTRPAISRDRFDGRLAMLTTTSALGKSAVYDRISYGGTPVYISVGFTNGWGEFHFSNGTYSAITAYARRYCTPSQRSARWGVGFRNRRELVEKCLRKLDIPKDWMNHGIKREVFVVPLASNSVSFLKGEAERLHWFSRPSAELSEFFKNRWLIPRSQRDSSFQTWDNNSWRLWGRGS